MVLPLKLPTLREKLERQAAEVAAKAAEAQDELETVESKKTFKKLISNLLRF